ncbi:acyl-CoA thioesterase [Bacillus timonensis]|uniref:acyl-CoA thioesterase n=1 Tax=Bacillus timonensis TaxID=1033734 RepID=UPI000289803E|nr:thioesterase family protein [Bacillus timonensis]
MEHFKFSHTIRVRYSEIDGQKIVFNAHYLTYIDIAFTEYMREILGSDWLINSHSLHFEPVLVKSTVEYKKPALLDDLIQVYVRVKKLGSSSLSIESVIKRENEILIEAETIQVNYNNVTKASAPIPDDIKERIQKFEGL